MGPKVARDRPGLKGKFGPRGGFFFEGGAARMGLVFREAR